MIGDIITRLCDFGLNHSDLQRVGGQQSSSSLAADSLTFPELASSTADHLETGDRHTGLLKFVRHYVRISSVRRLGTHWLQIPGGSK